MNPSKLSIFAVLVTFAAFAASQSTTPMTTSPSDSTTTKNPEEVASRIYDVIRNNRNASKNEIFMKLEDEFNMEMKYVRVNEFSSENCKRIIDSVTKRIQAGDPITTEEFRKFGDSLIQKWRASKIGR